jgi:prepilin-type N-terminal cleavage/methylation domain-containing protein
MITRTRGGFSLMELLLALALSGIVLMLLSMAIDMQWRLFDARRTGVEETLIARSVIRRISDDLRGAILYQPPDLEGLAAIANNPLAQSAGLTNAVTGGTSGAGVGQGTGTGNSTAGQGQGTGQGQTGQTSQTSQQGGGATTQPQQGQGTAGAGGGGTTQQGGGTTGNNANRTGGGTGTGSTGAAGFGNTGTGANANANGQQQPAEGEAAAPPVAIVGVYGGPDWLSIDVSRLPRIDEYQAVTAGGSDLTPIDIPSDVKTVSYYVATDSMADPSVNPESPVGEEGALPVLRGLVRQQLSRAITSFNEQGGGKADQISNAQVLAEEVTAIEFAYFDGANWYSDWNSTDMGGIPVAVAMAIEVQMKRSRAGKRVSEFMGEDPDAATTSTIHRMVVHLPAARKIVPSMTEEVPAEEGATETMP